MASNVGTNHVRNQRKNQNARQATMISGLSTIYRNQTTTHSIQMHQQTEPRIFLLDITLEDMNDMYSKIHGIIEKGRLRPKGTEVFFVTKKMEHFIISEDTVYEIRAGSSGSGSSTINTLTERIPIDGPVTTVEMQVSKMFDDDTTKQTTFIVPLLVDESYYQLSNVRTPSSTNVNAISFVGSHISPNHIIEKYMKIVIKLHPKSMNSFVFIMNEDETQVLDFYITTENGIIENRQQSKDIITKTCKDDIISFIEHFKICS